jgi:hypothetical protein
MKDLQLLKIKNCPRSIRNREEWRIIVEKVKTFTNEVVIPNEEEA